MAPEQTTSGPVAPAERLGVIDALRGLALFGVLAMNLETIFRVSIFQQFLPGPPSQGLERAIGAGLEILLDFKAFGFKYPKSLRIARFVRWGLHFCNDHPAKREGTFERMDIHPCQITVGRDIPRR